jgi:DNA-binding Xre family transcriptional regulator
VKSHITKEANISWATVNKIFDDKTVQVDMVAQLCKTYNLRVEQVIVFLNKELDEQNKKNEVAPTVVT